MDTYYYEIIYRNGTKFTSGTFSGVGAEASCERQAIMQFDMFHDQWERANMDKFFEPVRYVVKSY